MRRPCPADVLLGALALVLLASTAGLARNHFSRPPLPLLSEWQGVLPEGVERIGFEEARRLHGQEALFIDARETVRYEDGHIPGALSLPAEEFEDLGKGRARQTVLYTLRAAETVVVYCDGPECQASDRLARLLAEEGVRNLKVYPGGWPEWEAAGLPSVGGP